MRKRRIRKKRLIPFLILLIILIALSFIIFKKKDKEFPVIKLTGETNITLPLNGTYEELGYEANDNIDGDISKKVEIDGTVDTAKAGDYVIKYKVKDSSGNETTKERKIKISNISPLTMNIKEFTLDGLFNDVMIKESKDGGEEYTNQFIFAGDSMALYYVINSAVPGTRLWHQISITSATALTSPIYINHLETNKTFVQNFQEKKPEKVLFTLGTNSVATMTPEYFIEKYKELITEIKKASPNTLLIIQSIPPVNKSNDDNGYGLNNDKINKFNYYIAKMCSELKIPFLYSAPAMKDENGQCKEGYCLVDGAHPTALGTQALLKYMQTHVVK